MMQDPSPSKDGAPRSSPGPPGDGRAETVSRRSLLSGIVRWPVWTCVGLILGLAALFAFLQTRTGKDLLAAWASVALEAGTGADVRIDGIEGLVPLDFSIRSATLGGEADPWLRVEKLSVLWLPEDLLKGRIHVGHVEAAEVMVLRRPPERDGKTVSGLEATWPPSLPPILLDRFLVKRVSVDSAVLGKAARFTASGHVSVTGTGNAIRGEFRVRRLDAPEERAGVRWVLSTDPVRLELDLQVTEPENGMLSRLAGVSPDGLRLRVSGTGPPDGWRGEVEAESGAWGGIRSGIRVDASRERLVLEAEGDLRVGETLLPEQAAGLLESGTVGFFLRGSTTREGLVTVDRLALAAEGIEARVSGRFLETERAGEARVQLTVPDLARMRWPGLDDAGGRLVSRATVRGSLGAPEADLEMELSDLRLAGVEAGSATASFQVRTPEGASFPSLEGLRVLGEGAVRDLAVPGLTPTLRRDRTDWSLDARFSSSEALSIASLRVTDEGLESVLSGDVRLPAQSLDGRLQLTVQDLARAPFLEGTGVQGEGSLSAWIQADGVGRSLFADVEGRLEGAEPVPAWLAPLIGTGGTFRGRVSLLNGRTVQVSRFRVLVDAAEIGLEGQADLVERTGRLSVQADIPELGVLSGPARRSVAGEAVVRAEAQGAFRDPRIDAGITARDVEVAGISLKEARASFEAGRLLPAPAGRFRLEILQDGTSVSAGSDVALDRPMIALRNVSVEGAGVQASGGLTLHLPSATAAGDLNGTVRDLAPVGALLDRDLRGRAGFALHLSREGGGQAAALDLRIDDLASDAGNAERISVRGNVRGLFEKPAGEIAVRVEGARSGSARLASLEVNAAGTMDELSFDVRGDGEAGVPFRISSRGGYHAPAVERVLELETLEGALGSHHLRLEAPAEVRFPEQGGFQTSGLTVRVGGGGLTLAGAYGKELDLRAHVEALPLTLLSLAGGPPMQGTVGGVVRVSGTPRAPRAEVELTGEGVRPDHPSLDNLPGFRIAAATSLEGDLLEGRLSVTGPEDRVPLEAALKIPAGFSLSPLSVELPGDREIQGRIAADLDLEPFPLWLGLEGQRLSGRLEADLSISGSPAAPEIRGDARVRDGSLEILQSGSVFRNVDVLLRVDGRSLLLEHARADDGNGGSMEAGGRLEFLAEPGFPFEGRVSMDGFRLVRLDDLTAVTGGSLGISGTVRRADLSGNVRVTSAEVRIPDRLPPKIHELEVVEVNGETAPENESPEAGTSPDAPEINLNLDVEIPGRAFVRGRGLDSEWKGKLRVGGTVALPEVHGDLSIVRGHFNFLGERFALASGTVLFDGSHPPKPLMEITAERRKAGMTGRVILSGTPSSLSVQVASDPPMPKDEVMARLLFDRSLSSITPIQALKLARAMDALAGGGRLGFLDRARSAVGLDQIEVVQSGEEGGSTALSLGKYVSEEAYVEMEKGLGADGGKVSVEYEVTPRVTVETEVGTDAAGGVEVKWKWDY